MLPAETAHSISLASAEFLYKSWIKNLFITKKVNASNKLMGINFPNKLGLAAGFDKNGDYLNFDNNIGLGFIELGTITPKAQYGNNSALMYGVLPSHTWCNQVKSSLVFIKTPYKDDLGKWHGHEVNYTNVNAFRKKLMTW